MADRHIISVVIPVFRNEKSVSLTHAALIQLFDFDLNNKYQLELIFVAFAVTFKGAFNKFITPPEIEV